MSDTTNETKPSRADIARANGAKSRGPVTPRGKAISSRNATRHGLTSSQVLLPDESDDSYRKLRRSYFDHFRPRNIVERDLVLVLAVTQWRLLRVISIETDYLTREIDADRENVRRRVKRPDSHRSIAWTFSRVSGSHALPLIVRYEASLHRTYDRAFKQLTDLRAEPNKNIGKQTQDSLPPVETNPAS